jgi:hypothetical protein
MNPSVNHNEAPGPTLTAFESLDFDVATFNHECHVAVAWRYLQQYDLLDAISRYRDTLRRLTVRIGVPDKYHETITWFYLIAVAEGATGEARDDWFVFRDRNPALFQREPSIVRRFYSADRLGSDVARQHFVLPDLIPG